MRVSLRRSIASSLAMTFFAVSAGLIGKLLTGQVPLWLSVFTILGALPGAKLGTYVNSKLSLGNLRLGFIILLVIISARIWVDVYLRIFD